MFQELLIADLVVVDLTIDNPNVWYELACATPRARRGADIRWAGDQGVDVYTDRKVSYVLRDGGPDPDSSPTTAIG